MHYSPAQKRILLKGVILAACLAALAVGLFYIKEIRERESAVFFSNTLRDAQVEETVSIHGIQYSVNGGEVFQQQATTTNPAIVRSALQLAYEKRVARYEPLLALPGVDPAAFAGAVDGLRTAQQHLAAEQKDAKSASLVSGTLYPTGFLDSIAHLETDRRAFLGSGSDSDAAAYEQAQADAIAAYRKDLANFRTSFSIAVPADTTIQYVTQENTIGRASVLSALSTLNDGMSDIAKKFAQRQSCISGQTSACAVSDLALPALPDSNDAVSDSSLSLAERIRTLLKESGFPVETTIPLVVLPQSSCVAPRAGTDFLFSFQKRQSDDADAYVTPLFVGNIPFVESTSYRQVPLFDAFAAKGTSLVYQESLTFYTCPEIDREIGTVMSVYSVFSFAQTEPVSRYASGPDAQALRNLEKQLSTSPYITKHMASGYIRAAYAVSLSSATMPQATKERIVNLWLEMTDRSEGTYLTMRNIGFFETTPPLVDSNGNKITLDGLNLFFARSAFPALFMESNPSVTATHGSLFPTSDATASQPYVYYSDMPRTAATQSEIVHDLSSYYTTEIQAP